MDLRREYVSLASIHPKSDLGVLLLMDNVELQETLVACRIVYDSSKAENTDFNKELFHQRRLKVIREILELRAKHDKRSPKERLLVLVED